VGAVFIGMGHGSGFEFVAHDGWVWIDFGWVDDVMVEHAILWQLTTMVILSLYGGQRNVETSTSKVERT
jgi:hypothetical protein